MTLKATPNATSLPGSADGAMPSGSRDGRMSGPCGRGAFPASRSASREREPEQMTLGICGPSSTGLSASDCLSMSLASRCRERLGAAGSMEYRQTWKKKATPSGRLYWAHTASARRTSGNGSGGWPTLMAGTPAQKGYNEAGNTDSSRKTVALVSGWTTPQTHDAQGRSNPERLQRHGTKHGCRNLNDEAGLAGWPTATDSKDQDHYRKGDLALPGQARITSTASTEKRGQLDPAFVLWLQGFPIAWLLCAPSKIGRGRK